MSRTVHTQHEQGYEVRFPCPHFPAAWDQQHDVEADYAHVQGYGREPRTRGALSDSPQNTANRLESRDRLVWTAPRPRRPFSAVLNWVAQNPHSFDLYLKDIARLHEDRRLTRRPNTTGCSGDDHITRL